MSSKTKQKFTRKKKVVYDRVRFAVPEVFGEDELFDLPSMRQMPLGVSRTMRTDPTRFMNWITDNSPTEAQVEAIDSLSDEESEIFMGAWGKASKAAAGKS